MRRGRKRQLEVEAAYWRLLGTGTGIGVVAACAEVGISRKTGYRWRAETGGLAPEVLAEEDRSSRYLSRLERHRVATLRRDGLAIREIARRLDRAPSTISRELTRNTALHDRGGYDGDLAHARARGRTRRARTTRLAADPVLLALVRSKLELEWSHEQIAAYLRVTFPKRPAWHLCQESLYQGLYRGGRGGLCRTLTARLRTGRPLRQPRRSITARSPRYIAPAQLIDARPAEAGQRTRLGDWEGDLIVGRLSQSAIATLVDRLSRLIRLVHLPGGHGASDLRVALREAIGSWPQAARTTLTWDQGSEMAEHDRIADLFTGGIFFAHPASPWERPSNENTNGLLRQYFPKRTDLRAYSPARLAEVEHRMNTRPRKTLGWATPLEVYTDALAGSQPLALRRPL